MKKKNLIWIFLLLIGLGLTAAAQGEDFSAGAPVIIMTHPTLFQVQNIVELYEKTSCL